MIRWYCRPNHGAWTTSHVHLGYTGIRVPLVGSGKLCLCHLPWSTETSSRHWRQPETITRVQRWRASTAPGDTSLTSRCLWVSTDPTCDRYGRIPSARRRFRTILATGVSQWSRLQCVSLAGTCHADVLADSHDIALQSSHVVDQGSGMVVAGASDAVRTTVEWWTPNVLAMTMRSARLGACQWPDLYELATVVAPCTWTLWFWIPFRWSCIGTECIQWKRGGTHLLSFTHLLP